MGHWEIPHDEAHRFLRWGLRDEIFNSWCLHFKSKGIEFEVGGARDEWTIYKHMRFTDINKRNSTPCCPREEDL